MADSLNNLAVIQRLDRLGFSASTFCAIHCALVPFLIAVLPLAGFGFITHPHFETAMIALSLIVGAGSLTLGYLRHHQRLGAIFVLAAGFSLIFLGHTPLFEALEPVLVPAGALAVACSHLINWRLCKTCALCNPDGNKEERGT
jgi:hypothetical protein